MIDIDKARGEAKIYFNRDFYRISAINECCKQFGSLYKIDIKKGKRIEVLLKPKTGKKISDSAYELCNYVLASMKNKNLV